MIWDSKIISKQKKKGKERKIEKKRIFVTWAKVDIARVKLTREHIFFFKNSLKQDVSCLGKTCRVNFPCFFFI